MIEWFRKNVIWFLTGGRYRKIYMKQYLYDPNNMNVSTYPYRHPKHGQQYTEGWK